MDALTLDDLLTLEHRGWDSLCHQGGGAFYGHLMTDDGLMVLVNGMVMDRDAVVASLDGAPAWDSYQITEPRLVALGTRAACLVYRASARRGDEDPFEALMSSSYVVDDAGRTRLAMYQQTTITH